MPLDKRDAARLWGMLTYARETLESLADVSFAEYLENRTLRLATERRLEIIGTKRRGVFLNRFRKAIQRSPGGASLVFATYWPMSMEKSSTKWFFRLFRTACQIL